MNDAQTSIEAKKVARVLRSALQGRGFEVDDEFPSGFDGGWIVEAVRAGFMVNVEILGGPWNDDGTFEAVA